MNTIGKRIKIVEQNVAQDNMDSFDDILNIPEFLSSITNECKNERGTDITKEGSINNSKMIIEILFRILPEPNSTNSSEQSSNCHILKTPYQNLTFDNITAKYKLDFKQRVAFEIMACSYILRCLKNEYLHDDKIYTIFGPDKSERNDSLNRLSLLKEKIKNKGGVNNLVTFFWYGWYRKE